MPLIGISVIGPLSECSTSVRVQGQISGATVEIFMTGHSGSIGGGVASWSDQSFPVTVALKNGQTVTATQKLGSDTSQPGPGISVQKKPPSLGSVAFQSHLYECGRCVWLVGAFPGATVSLTVLGSPRGSTVSPDGNARIGLTQQLGPSDILVAQQTGCGLPPGVTISGPKPDPTPVNAKRQVPAPSLPGPLEQCDPAVQVTNVFEGSTVTLTRSAGPTESACFDATGLWFVLSTPLVLGETVTAVQNYPKCDVQGVPTAPATVGPIKVEPPVVKEPLCASQTTVTVTDYKPGSIIEIFQNGVSLGAGQAPEEPLFSFGVPPLVGGDVITARQTRCGKTSVDSNAVPVDPAPKSMPTPVVPGPLVECASVVRVENLHIGARVYVFSTLLAAEIGDAQAFDTTVDVPVAPLLILGDKIFARQIGCGHTSHNSTPPQTVGKAPQLKPPHVAPPLDDCMSAVPVDRVEPGALVDVYVNNLPRGTAAAGGTSVTVPISGRLKVRDSVKARQRLCNQVTGFGEPTGVNPSAAKDWPMYHHDAQHSGRVACSDINSSNVATLKPAFPALTLNGDIISVPAVVAGKIYVGTSIPVENTVDLPGGGTLYRIDLATGTIEQTFNFVTPPNQGSNQGESGIGCTPAVTGGHVYFSALDGNIRCLDAASFSVKWTTNLRAPDPPRNQPVSNPVAETWSSPLMVNNRVYVGAGEGESGAYGFLYCLDADTGKVIWLFCTNQFAKNVDNQPNVVPGSTVGGTIPPGYVGFSVGPEPLSKGSSVWSSCAYHAGLKRIYFGTGNPDPDSPLPNTPYGSGIVSLDASTGDFKGFFQPLVSDSYRPDDSDIDFPCPPTVYSIPGQDVVTIGGKNGATFLLDPANFNVLARRQLLPKDGAGNPLPSVDPHAGPGENLWGVFASAAADPAWGHIYYGLGGYEGVDAATTPFMRACDWATLDDEWPTVKGADTVTRYSTAQPPMYMTSEAGLSSPVVVNDVVLVATSAPGQAPALYGFSSANGVPLWLVPGFAKTGYCLGLAVYGDYVLAAAGDQLVVYTL